MVRSASAYDITVLNSHGCRVSVKPQNLRRGGVGKAGFPLSAASEQSPFCRRPLQLRRYGCCGGHPGGRRGDAGLIEYSYQRRGGSVAIRIRKTKSDSPAGFRLAGRCAIVSCATTTSERPSMTWNVSTIS